VCKANKPSKKLTNEKGKLIMSNVFTSRGRKAKESAQKKNVQIDFKKVFLRLKDGDSVRVRILSAEDYIEYIAHGSYPNGIYTQPCIEVAGERCLYEEVVKLAKEDESLSQWSDLYAKKRYLFAFYDIDEKMVRVFDASKGQGTPLMDTIEEYEEDLNEIAFTFKRSGNKTDTTYTLSPIMPKQMTKIQDLFDEADGFEVEDELFNTVLNPRTTEQQYEELKKAGFPVERLAPVAITKQAEAQEEENITEIADEAGADLTKGF
jgi:hypothetical protein